MAQRLWVCLRVATLPIDVFARAWSPDEQARPFVVSSGAGLSSPMTASRAGSSSMPRPSTLPPTDSSLDREAIHGDSARKSSLTLLFGKSSLTLLSISESRV